MRQPQLAGVLVPSGSLALTAGHLTSAIDEQAFPPKPFPKIPAKLLRNFSPRGPLHIIAATIHDVRRARDLKKFDLLAPEFRKQVTPVAAHK